MGVFDGAFGAGLGSIMGIGSSLFQQQQNRRNIKLQYKQQRELMGLQTDYQKQLNAQGRDIQLQMWRDTNYPAQLEMLKEAGLNPGLLYGMGGAGGATTGGQTGGNAQGGQAPSAIPFELNLQNALLASQIKKTESEADLNKAREEKTAGVDTELAKGTLNQLIADTKNKTLQGELIKLQTIGTEIENTYKPYKLMAEVDNWVESAQKLKIGNELTQAQFDDLVKEQREKAIGQAIINDLNKSNIKYNEEKIREISESIDQKWQQISINWGNLANAERQTLIHQFEAEIKAEYPNIGNATGKWINEMYDMFGTLDMRDPNDRVRKVDGKTPIHQRGAGGRW